MAVNTRTSKLAIVTKKRCLQCSQMLTRKRFGTRLEDMGVFRRRRYCNLQCRGSMKHAETMASPSGMTRGACRRRARQMVPPGPCERCGTMNALDVHHKDHDWTNNAPENLERICRSCHIRDHRPARICRQPRCQSTTRGGAHGLCVKHYQRWKKWGDPRLVKDNQHTPVRVAAD